MTPLIRLKYGQTTTVRFALFANAGAAFPLAGYSVTAVVTGSGGYKKTFACTIDSPSSLGTAFFQIQRGEYATLKVGSYDGECYVHDADEEYMVGRFEIKVTSTPQRI